MGVMGLAAAGALGAAGAGAATVAVVEQQALGFGGQAFGAAHVERFGGVVAVDDQVVMGVLGQADRDRAWACGFRSR